MRSSFVKFGVWAVFCSAFVALAYGNDKDGIDVNGFWTSRMIQLNAPYEMCSQKSGQDIFPLPTSRSDPVYKLPYGYAKEATARGPYTCQCVSRSLDASGSLSEPTLRFCLGETSVSLEGIPDGEARVLAMESKNSRTYFPQSTGLQLIFGKEGKPITANSAPRGTGGGNPPFKLTDSKFFYRAYNGNIMQSLDPRGMLSTSRGFISIESADKGRPYVAVGVWYKFYLPREHETDPSRSCKRYLLASDHPSLHSMIQGMLSPSSGYESNCVPIVGALCVNRDCPKNSSICAIAKRAEFFATVIQIDHDTGLVKDINTVSMNYPTSFIGARSPSWNETPCTDQDANFGNVAVDLSFQVNPQLQAMEINYAPEGSGSKQLLLRWGY